MADQAEPYTALTRSSAVVSVPSTLAPLKTRLETAVANLKTADPGRPSMLASNKVGEALEAIRTAIDGDDGLKARTALAKLSSDIGGVSNMALNDDGRAKFSTEVIEILRNEINKGGKRRRRGKTLRRRKQHKTRRRGFRGGGGREALQEVLADVEQFKASQPPEMYSSSQKYTPNVDSDITQSAIAFVSATPEVSEWESKNVFKKAWGRMTGVPEGVRVKEFLTALLTPPYTFTGGQDVDNKIERLKTFLSA
jgi:hypothetical protein